MPDTQKFREALHSAGLDYAGQIHADGKLHRFKAEGDHDRNSWYVLYAGVITAGAFGCWKRDIKENYCDRSNTELSAGDRNTIHANWHRAEQARNEVEAKRRESARRTATWILSRSQPAIVHPYLDKKGVKAYGAVRLRADGFLVLPLRDANGELHSLQFISPDATKRFLRGGKVSGCFVIIGEKTDGPVVVCEGYVTGATIHEATGFMVVCAMNCGNILATCESLRAKWPLREIIIAGDNDQYTPANPGVSKATAAAKAVGAKLIIPQFQDSSSKPTDFNDLHHLEGLETVKTQINHAENPQETEDEIIARLAAMPMLEYEKWREAASDKLTCRAAVLDKLVEAKRSHQKVETNLQGGGVDLHDVEVWPDPVDGAAVLAEAADIFNRYLVLPAGAADTLALWCAHAHAFTAFLCTPRLNITSPDKGCGKTTCRDVVSLLVPRPLSTENMSTPVLFRLIEAKNPTLLADEYDAWLNNNEELRGLLNAGHRRGGAVYRCEGDNHDVRSFKVFAPVVLAGIGSLPGTLHDRSIQIKLERAKPGEVRNKFDSRRTDHEQEICRKLARWCADNASRLENCDPVMPSGAFNRLADNWRPLFAIAEIIGGVWPARLVTAFEKITSAADLEAQGIGTCLLADIATIFEAAKTDRLQSTDICEALIDLEGKPWAEIGRNSSPITVTKLAKLLRPFSVGPRTIRFDSPPTAKGYLITDFDDAFARYVPACPISARNNVTSLENKEDSQGCEPAQCDPLLRVENMTNANDGRTGDGVTVQNTDEPLML